MFAITDKTKMLSLYSRSADGSNRHTVGDQDGQRTPAGKLLLRFWPLLDLLVKLTYLGAGFETYCRSRSTRCSAPKQVHFTIVFSLGAVNNIFHIILLYLFPSSFHSPGPSCASSLCLLRIFCILSGKLQPPILHFWVFAHV